MNDENNGGDGERKGRGKGGRNEYKKDYFVITYCNIGNYVLAKIYWAITRCIIEFCLGMQIETKTRPCM